MMYPNPTTACRPLSSRRLLPSLLGFTCFGLGILAAGPLRAQVTTEQLDALRPRNIGPAVMSGRIVDLAVAESDPIKFYVASATGGVYKTGDNGITLVPVFENEGTHSVGAIALPGGHLGGVGRHRRAGEQAEFVVGRRCVQEH